MVLYLQSCFLKAELCISALNGRNVPELQSVLLGVPPPSGSTLLPLVVLGAGGGGQQRRGARETHRWHRTLGRTPQWAGKHRSCPRSLLPPWGMRDTPALRSEVCSVPWTVFKLCSCAGPAEQSDLAGFISSACVKNKNTAFTA